MRFVFYAAAAGQEAEHGKTLLIAHYRLAVDQIRRHLELVDRRNNGRQTFRFSHCRSG
jgi:hypothetical protein